MPLIKYIDWNPTAKSRETLEKANEIINHFEALGFDLTLRQLYYQFVARDLIPNTERSYKNLGNLINKGRLAGLIDWNSIVDRTREVRAMNHWTSPDQIIQSSADQYRIDKWFDQSNYVEVWVEKDALIGVIEPICQKLDIDCFSCRGFTSQSAVWRASNRFTARLNHLNREKVIVLYLGDHDPSGLDMDRDLQERFWLFEDPKLTNRVKLRRIALSMDQIQLYSPPPNPTKLTDSRASKYISAHGDSSWELDALDPTVIADLIGETVGEYRDEILYGERELKEKSERALLSDIAEKITNNN